MNANTIPRRDFLKHTAGALALVLFSPVCLGETKPLRFSGWGSADRARITNEAFALFEAAHPDIRVEAVFTDWLDYWLRLSTLVALGDTPDLIQMDYRYLEEYARSRVIEPLDPFLGDLLDIDSFGTHNIDSCRIDGRLYGVNLGINATAAFIDRKRWLEAEVEPPAIGESWQTFHDKCVHFAVGTPREHYYPTMDASGLESAFEAWLLQQGKSLYKPHGQLGFEAADATAWFDFWAELRAKRACVPVDIQILFRNSVETSPLTLGYSAMDFAHSNMMLNYQQQIDRPLGITACPVTPGGRPGHYYKPSQMLSVAAGLDAERQRRTVELANFLVMDPAAVKVLGVDRGIPASSEMRMQLAPTLDDVGRATLTYIDDLEPYVGPLPPVPPSGAGEIAIVLQRISHEIGYGVSSTLQGGRQLVEEAEAILTR
ncbi:carbohydrate ABC transporter substrate-binding protein [Halomonas daqingensis]|uniref:Carbohydrate ABC transporter substrate-binding protein n=1 Tax=Billgrantia desiderata TaxID=52021 RepID=A0AAW4YPB9_9GAMM|nr:ABC transporter substrate-binding protein [Halomonas desiderata]MCE8049847.1 carbohydrate ABC transporter substrate-binding protein [Halomonas desiderata]